jgi:hypothetical protein
MCKSNADVNTKMDDSMGKFHSSPITLNKKKKMWGTIFHVSPTVKQKKNNK